MCERFGFSQRFADVLAGLDRLAATSTLPQSVPELKRLLCRLPEFDYEAAVRTLMRTEDVYKRQVYDACICMYRKGFIEYLKLEDMGSFTAYGKQNKSPEKLNELKEFGRSL